MINFINREQALQKFFGIETDEDGLGRDSVKCFDLVRKGGKWEFAGIGHRGNGILNSLEWCQRNPNIPKFCRHQELAVQLVRFLTLWRGYAA